MEGGEKQGGSKKQGGGCLKNSGGSKKQGALFVCFHGFGATSAGGVTYP